MNTLVMSSYTDVKNLIISNIKANGQREITGPILQDVLLNMLENSSRVEEITYSDLKALRDDAKLTPSRLYRITDYITTTVQSNTKSAGHPFDVIVLTISESELLEQAWAIQHEGDIYFDNSALSSWQIYYSLDNDTNRFAWADGTNGKGVIYRMIDEFGNDCPYDFKNIQFKHPKDTTTYPYYYYTFASSNMENNTDCSLDIVNRCYSNTIKEYVNSGKRTLNQIILFGSDCYCNSFGYNCYNNVLHPGCHFNTFGNNCSENTLGANCSSNTLGNNCHRNTFSEICSYNIFDNNCVSNTWGNNCSNNSFGSDCSYNTFGDNCMSNTFGAKCWWNTLVAVCGNNIFRSDCSYNTLGMSSSFNILESSCWEIKFASDKLATTKDNFYKYNHFCDGCKYILFKGGTGGSNSYVQNYKFAQGTSGTSSAYLTIDGKRNRAYETYISRDTDGTIKESVIADNTNNISTLTTNLSNEISARTQADTELQTQINSKQEALTLTVKDNGNIVLANIQGQSKEFMSATPSGDPMHYAYVAAGAEYNDTGADIIKTAPWADLTDDDADKTVVHKAGYWYLNGLGDLTNNDMLHIMQTNRPFSYALYAGTSHKFRTNLCFEDNNPFIFVGRSDCTSLLRNNANIKVLRLPISTGYDYKPNKVDELCLDSAVIHITNVLQGENISNYSRAFDCNFLRTIKIKSLKCNISFSMVSGLTLKSVLYMINNEAATAPITITLHADVYNRCMANVDILTALETHTNISLASA